jgi:tetratricopeptide (TPR) repeat protein
MLCLFVGMHVSTSSAAVVKWEARDIHGTKVSVPVDRPSLIAFVRPDQEQSKQAIKQIQSIAGDTTTAQVIVVLSGPLPPERVAAFARELPAGWLTVADPEFAASGKMNIHVWPTTLVVKSDGLEVAHLAGMPKSFASELHAYLDLALGKINETTLKQRLGANDIVTDGPEQVAARHLQVAQRMLEQGHIEQARGELNQGLKHNPQDPMLQLTLARVHVLLNEPAKGVEILDRLPAGSVPAWQLALVRGRALVALEKWSEAKSILPDALKLNPNPAEAHYLLGLCHQHDGDFRAAAEQFRLAFEKSAAGQKLVSSPPSR